MSHDSLDAAIAGYLLAVEAGDVPNRRELLERYPEHADALRAFLADLDRMDRVASPLRLDGGLEATDAVEANGPIAPTTIRYFGDYELLEEIARGGMGIVYKARQVSLNRLVALKMILAGSFASSRDVQRFRTEAESAANLDHPHIVPIYEVGEHEGQQYYSMKFVEGTSLSNHPRSDPRREVEGLVGVIRAVHHAHQRGVLHRDLKPSNVLVDSQGTRLVTDFGLAKRMASGDGSITETGQVLGTPKYMAPEQAAGRKDLTVAADVYSLGVILYERLTGQTPFSGDNALTLLRQAREAVPPRPSTIRSGLDRDLETVVLRCLEKEAGRRYPSAEALADDLDRWLRGEPIQARPVGQVERLWRWCKRNPAISSLTVAVAASLVIGIVISTFFAVLASRRAQAESRERARATKAERDVEGTFVRSLIRPLNPEATADIPSPKRKPWGGTSQYQQRAMLTKTGLNMMMMGIRESAPSFGRLSGPETQALWELSEHPEEPLWQRVLEEGTRTADTTRQLAFRSESALIAAIGLDTSRRARAARVLANRLGRSRPGDRGASRSGNGEMRPSLEGAFGARSPADDVSRPDDTIEGAEHQADLILLGLQLVEEPDASTRAWAGMIADTLGRDALRNGWDELLAEATPRMESRVAAEILTAATAREIDSSLAIGLVAFADRIEPGEAAVILAGTLSRANERNAPARGMGMMGGSPGTPSEILSYGLASVAMKSDSPRVTPMLTNAFEQARDAGSRSALAEGLKAVAERFGSPDANNILNTNCEKIVKYKINNTLPDLEESEMNSLAGLIHPIDAAEVLVGAIRQERDGDIRSKLITLVAKVAARLEPATAARMLAEAEVWVTDQQQITPLVEELARHAERLGPAEAETVCGPVARRIASVLGKEAPSEGIGAAALNLTILSARINSTEAEKLCGEAARILMAMLRSGGNLQARPAIVRGLASLSVRLGRDEAIRVARFLASFDWHYGDHQFHELLTATMAPADAPKAARVLLAAFEQEVDPHARWMLAAGLLLVSQKLGPVEAARHCAPVFPSLIASFVRDKEQYYSYMANGLVGVASALDPARAREAVQILDRALERRVADQDLRGTLFQGLVTAGMRVGSEEATRLIGIQLGRERSPDDREQIISSLAGAVQTMTEAEVSSPGEVARMLDLTLNHEMSPSSRETLISRLITLTARIKGPDANQVVARAAELLLTEWEKNEVERLSATELTALAEKMKEQDATHFWRRVGRLIEGRLRKRADRPSPDIGQDLIDIAVISGRMGPAEGAAICRGAIRYVLNQRRAPDIKIIPLLTQLEHETARKLATELALWTCAQSDIDEQDLDAILTELGRRISIKDMGRRVYYKSQPPTGKTLPCRLTTQSLVELLKMPTCFGEPRQVVLDHLGNRYGRRFFNHWEFVRYAKEHGLGLDFTTPPKRPDPKETVKRMLEILDEPAKLR
jgi:serine/threonine protein kinase